MDLELDTTVRHIFVLGAGASADYGLPLWKGLDLLIKKKIDKDNGNVYQYKKETLDWIDKIGEDKEYKTLDQCITTESISDTYPNGDDIEDQIFRMLREIFDEQYKKDALGWVRKLNNAILLNGAANIENEIAFVNYNYDRVLEDLLLDYSYLHKKLIRNNYRERLSKFKDIVVDVLYPHGNLYQKAELNLTSHTKRYIETVKSHDRSQVDAVSCYESREHSLHKSNYASKVKLYILGLGGGLEVNLKNINLINPVSEIHVTVNDQSLRDGVLNFLTDKYKFSAAEIKIYNSCEELVEKCFPTV